VTEWTESFLFKIFASQNQPIIHIDQNGHEQNNHSQQTSLFVSPPSYASLTPTTHQGQPPEYNPEWFKEIVSATLQAMI
jgi:hypothetical protein